MSLSTQVREKVEPRPTAQPEPRPQPQLGRGFLIMITAVIGIVLAGTVIAIMLDGKESATTEIGWGLEPAELAMIEDRLAPGVASAATVWDLSPAEMEFITGRISDQSAASAPIGVGDLSPTEVEFITGRFRSTEPSPGRWYLDPAELAFLTG